MPKNTQIIVAPEEPHIRLDVFLSSQPLGLSRNHIQLLIDKGEILLNGKPAKPSHKISPSDVIHLTFPNPEPLDVEPENIPLDVVFEDEQMIIINKPVGMVVHPAAGAKHGTLVNALLYHCKNLSGIGGIQRPGIVHRIDKGTSGLIMVAKTDVAHQSLSAQLKKHTITRKYLALVYGKVKLNEGYVETQMGRHPVERKKMAVLKEGGRKAGTFYKVLQRFPLKIPVHTQRNNFVFTLVECKLTTGRTHQIRVHLAHIGNPVVGDSLYGKGRSVGLEKDMKNLISVLNGFALHAQVLGFQHPVTQKYLEFSTDPPPPFQALLHHLNTK